MAAHCEQLVERVARRRVARDVDSLASEAGRGCGLVKVVEALDVRAHWVPPIARQVPRHTLPVAAVHLVRCHWAHPACEPHAVAGLGAVRAALLLRARAVHLCGEMRGAVEQHHVSVRRQDAAARHARSCVERERGLFAMSVIHGTLITTLFGRRPNTPY